MTSKRRSRACGVALMVSVLAAALCQGGAECAVHVWSTNGPEGGRVTVLKIDPFAADHVLAGTYSSGIFRSIDGGERWRRANTPSEYRRPGATETIAFDPGVAGRVYAADGWDNVLRSDDGGLSWTRVSNQRLFSLAVDPRDSMVYGYGIGGFWRSTDGGATWTRTSMPVFNKIAVGTSPTTPVLLHASAPSGVLTSSDRGVTWSQSLTSNEVVALAIHPSRSEIICAASVDGLYASRDGGISWSRFGNIGSAANRKFVDVAFDPANADAIFATSEEGLFKTTDFGGTWTAAGPYTGALAVGGGGQGGVYATTPVGIARSTDRGATWSSKNSGLVATDVTGLAVDPANTGTVYAASSVGLFKSGDGAATWSTPVPVYGQVLAIDPSNPDIVYLGGGSPNPAFNDRLNKSLDGGATWTRMEQGLSMRYVTALAIDPSHPTTLYAGFTSASDGWPLQKSIDGAATWTTLYRYPNNNNGVGELAIDPRSPQTLYAVGGGAYKSMDGGATWVTLVQPDIYVAVTSVAVDPQTSTVYVGSVKGLLKSTGGSLYLTAAGLDGEAVGEVLIDPRNSAILHAVTRHGVYTSADGGATWSALNDGLDSSFSVRDLAIDPRDPTVIHAATNAGVYTIGRNSPPVADAGSDQFVRWHGPKKGSVTLEGSGSSDPDGDLLTFSWSWSGGGVEGVSPTVELPFGTTEVTLVVRDPAGASAEDTVQVTVCRGRDPLHPKGCNPSSRPD